ncbi:MAG: outer membrane beta-barrel protein [Bacteroidetes bacterium]|nr:outer membrane beta-barrel protein [Bacteroidota bacterium]
MKRVLIVLLIGLFALDVDAQMMFNPRTNDFSGSGFSAGDDYSTMLKKRKKRRSSKRRGKSRGKNSGGGLAVGPGLMLGIPVGNFGKEVKTGIGFNLNGDYFVTPQLSIGAAVGYSSFKYDKKITLIDTAVIDFFTLNLTGKLKLIPFQLKFNYYFTDGPVKPYAGLALGLSVNNLKYEFSELTYFDNPVTGDLDSVNLTTRVTDKNTSLAIAPAFGVLFNISDNLALNICAKYEMFFMTDQQKYLLVDKKSNIMETYLGLNFGLVYTFGN